MMKVLVLNGSPHPHGCTATALDEVIKVLNNEGIETEIVQIGSQSVRGCIGCYKCTAMGKCAFDDIVNEIAPKFEEADGLLIGSPVYYSSPNGTILSFLDRLFFSTHFSKQMKVGAVVVSARRGGNTATFDALNKYLSICGMAIATSSYWNMVHGRKAEDVAKDQEGVQTMRNLGKNMAFLIKAIKLGKEQYGLPQMDSSARTSFSDGL